MEHHFNIEVAKEHGVEAAIFLQNLAFWTLRNVANKSHFKDGRYWIYNTQEAWTVLFPYWSRQNMRTIIQKCVDHGLILKGNYNEKNYDKTTWFSMTDKALTMFPTLKASIDATSLGWNQPRLVDNSDLSTDPWLESTNGLVGINQAIPDSKPDNKHKSFCDEQKKTKSDWKAENAKVHDFAEKMNNSAASQKQMEREAKHIEENKVFKTAGMPQELKDLVKRIGGGRSNAGTKDDRGMQKNVVQTGGETWCTTQVDI